MKSTFKITGLMSGTSLDGLDIAHCEFSHNTEGYDFKIIAAETVSIPEKLEFQLKKALQLTGLELAQLDVDFGIWMGKKCAEFHLKNNIKEVDAIASHGQTIFHQPEKSLTLQIGSGAHLAAESNCKVICNFRTSDVANGGNGAPLVPIGDLFLFPQFDACLNLGGFSNISLKKGNEIFAFDISPCNLVANFLANQLGEKFDENGKIAKSGFLNQNLLSELNSLEYYQKNAPKSLGYEWLEKHFLPILNKYDISADDKLNSCANHIAHQIAMTLNLNNVQKVLVTGGGAFNTYLIDLLKEKSKSEIIIPDEKIIHFKEALIFAFLGLLRLQEKENCLKSATGARKNSIGGAIFLS